MSCMDAGSAANPERINVFTTNVFAQKDRFAYWREVICTHLSPSEAIQHASGEPFRAHMKEVTIGRARVCDLEFSPMHDFRDAQCLRRMPDDDFFVALMKTGQGRLNQDKRCASPGTGDVVVYHSARPFEWTFEHPTRMIIARIPRRQMLARLPEIERLTARVIRSDHPLASVIGNTVSEIARYEAPLTESCAQRLGASLINILASCIEASLMGGARTAADDDLLKRAKAFLIDNMEDPSIDLERLTGHLGTSMRSICRAFAASGTTAMRWFWQQRLDLAFRLLSDQQVRNVSQVAMQCGFNDFSHFSRAFKKVHGVAPNAVLRHAKSVN